MSQYDRNTQTVRVTMFLTSLIFMWVVLMFAESCHISGEWEQTVEVWWQRVSRSKGEDHVCLSTAGLGGVNCRTKSEVSVCTHLI